MATDYKDLVVWQRARRLVKEIYGSTRSFPREELFGLTSQMRRAAVSVASNIAEGKGRNSRKELVQFLCVARGSLLELETHIQIARDLDYLDDTKRVHLANEVLTVVRPLNGLIARIRQEQ